MAEQQQQDNKRLWNVVDQYQYMDPQQIKEEYSKIASPVAVACLNLSGDMNIGTMMRTSSLFGVGKFLMLGRKFYDRRSSVGTQHHIPHERIYMMKGKDKDELDEESVLDILREQQKNHTIVFVEQHASSVPLTKLHTLNFELPPLFVFGSESNGIPASLLSLENSYSVVIPQQGLGRSHNVAIACGIVLYEWFRVF
jgi:tRNA G18 (ribose-2'-O)-methylase SpoU